MRVWRIELTGGISRLWINGAWHRLSIFRRIKMISHRCATRWTVLYHMDRGSGWNGRLSNIILNPQYVHKDDRRSNHKTTVFSEIRCHCLLNKDYRWRMRNQIFTLLQFLRSSCAQTLNHQCRTKRALSPLSSWISLNALFKKSPTAKIWKSSRVAL